MTEEISCSECGKIYGRIKTYEGKIFCGQCARYVDETLGIEQHYKIRHPGEETMAYIDDSGLCGCENGCLFEHVVFLKDPTKIWRRLKHGENMPDLEPSNWPCDVWDCTMWCNIWHIPSY